MFKVQAFDIGGFKNLFVSDSEKESKQFLQEHSAHNPKETLRLKVE